MKLPDKINLDDKDLVIIAVSILGSLAFVLDNPENTVNLVIAGLFAMAVGRKKSP